MSISNTSARRAGPYTTDGVDTVFPFEFKVFSGADLVVTSSEDGVETVLVNDTDYTVDLNADQEGDPGGTVTTLTALDGPTITITSDMDETQPTVFTNSGGFYPSVLNASLDRATILIQQLSEKVDRAALSPFDPDPVVGMYPVIAADGSFAFASGTGNDSALRTDLAASTGAALVGVSGGGSLEDFYAAATAVTDFGAETVGIGVAASSALLTLQTDTAFTGNAVHLYHYAQQTDPANQTSPLAIHNYTDGVSAIIDTVGAGVSLRLKQANNASARPDKASTYVGDGDFFEILRARTSGLGNTGAGSDILAKLDKQGSLRFYGADGDDWDGTDTTAPIIFGSYTGFFTETGYMGWDYANSRFIIGSIETGVDYLPIHFACSAFTVLGDGVVDFATPANRLGSVYAYNLSTLPVAVSALPSAASSAGMRAFVSDSNAAASGNFGAVVAAGGANYVPVYSDGTDWRIG